MSTEELTIDYQPESVTVSSSETRTMIQGAFGLLFAAYVAAPVILATTIGLGHLLVFTFITGPVGILAGEYFMIYVYSASQVVGGWVAGFRLKYAIVGPFAFCGSGMSPRVRWEPGRAGFSSIYVANDDAGITGEDLIRHGHYSFTVSVLVTLVLSMGLAALLVTGVSHWLLRVATVALCVTIIKLLIHFFSNWQTMRQSGGGPELERRAALHDLVRSSSEGVRPGDLDISRIRHLVGIPDGSRYEVSGWLMYYERALDNGDMAAAENALMRALTTVTQAHVPLMGTVFREAAFFTAHHGKDPATARIWLKQASGRAFELHAQARVEAAILLAEGSAQEAREQALLGLLHLDNSLDKGSARLDEDILNDILNQASAEIQP